MNKANAWLHPREMRYESPSYRQVTRVQAAAMIRAHKRRKAMYVQTDIHGRRWYVLTSERFIVAELCVSLRRLSKEN